MQVKMQVTYTHEEVADAMIREYTNHFGQPPKGSKLEATERYSSWIVETVENDEPLPVTPTPEEPAIPITDTATEIF